MEKAMGDKHFILTGGLVSPDKKVFSDISIYILVVPIGNDFFLHGTVFIPTIFPGIWIMIFPTII